MSCIICHGTSADGPFALTQVEGDEKGDHSLHGGAMHEKCAWESLKYSPNCSLCKKKVTLLNGKSVAEFAFAHSALAALERALDIFKPLASTIAHTQVYSDHPDNLVFALKEVLSENLAALKSALAPVPGALTDLVRAPNVESSIVIRAHNTHILTHNTLDRIQGAIDWVLFHFDAVRTQVLVDQVDTTIVDLSRKLADIAVVLASADSILTTTLDRRLIQCALANSSPATRNFIRSVLDRAEVAIIYARNAPVQVNPVRPEAQSNDLSEDDLTEILNALDAKDIDRAKKGLTAVLDFLTISDRTFGADARAVLTALNLPVSTEDRLSSIRARTNKVARDHFGATFIEARRSFFTERNNNAAIRAREDRAPIHDARRAPPNFLILSLIISFVICYPFTNYVYKNYFSGE